MTLSPIRTINGIALLAGFGLAGFFGYRLLRAELAADIWRDRLETVAADYEVLRSTYNEAVRRTAVTELVVSDEGALTVRVRNAAGEETIYETPYDPSGEVYVDYVVLDGRLWIRRIFDAKTPPSAAMMIDPALACVDWSAHSDAAHGKAIYRSLAPGRWVVSVTGNGALGLVRADDDVAAALTPPPNVRPYDEVAGETTNAIAGIGLGDVWGHLTGRDD